MAIYPITVPAFQPIRTDSYKLGHWDMIPEHTENVYAYGEGRVGAEFEELVFFGLQPYLEGLANFIPEIGLARDFARFHFGRDDIFNEEGWVSLVKKHGDKLPLIIRAIPEGTVVKPGDVLFTIEVTDPEFPWLTQYIESYVQKVWYPIVVASYSRKVKKMLAEALRESTGDIEGLDWKLHDFGYRSASSDESAAIGGSAHLVNFKGTDTVVAALFMADNYNPKGEGYETIAEIGNSVPASEHSVMTALGAEGEAQIVGELLKKNPTGILSVVGDSYDIYNFVENIVCKQYKNRILERNGTFVVRPDCYDEETQIMTTDGWKFFRELDDNALVLQMDEDGVSSFTKPLRIIAQDYNGDMIHFTDEKEKVDLLVTPNHRMVWEYQNNRDERNIQIVSAEESLLNNYRRRLLRSPVESSLVPTSLTPLERFLIAFQADGSAYERGKYAVFNFAKKRKTDRLLEILDQVGLEYKTSQPKARNGQTVIRVYAREIYHLLDKDFTWVPSIEHIDTSFAREFIEELSHWDATIRNDGRIKFDTTNEEAIQVVERVAIAAGYGVLLTKSPDNRKEIFSDVHTAHIMRNNYIGTQAITKKTVPYSGKVYCVEVPDGMVLVKRNRAIAVSGNSNTPRHPNPEDQVLWIYETLWEAFGGTVTDQKYMLLNPQVNVLWGDGIDFEGGQKIVNKLIEAGFVPTIVLGMGSGLLQDQRRDDARFAIKSSAQQRDGVWYDVVKNPLDKSKKSKAGRFDHPSYNLHTVFENGRVVKTYDFREIRERANQDV